MKDKMRKSFEAWFIASGDLEHRIEKYESGIMRNQYKSYTAQKQWLSWQGCAEANQAELARLRGALVEYGRHHSRCKLPKMFPRPECNCGYDKALSNPGVK